MKTTQVVFVSAILLLVVLSGCVSRHVQTPMSLNGLTSVEFELLQHLKFLSSDQLNGRKVGSHGSYLAQQYIIDQLQSLSIPPLSASYRQAFSFNRRSQTYAANNIVALVRGTAESDRYIVLSAHFDHLGGQGTRIYNGADDNASGTAALLNYAKKLAKAPLRHHVILLFSDGEEANLKGAKAFAQQHKTLMPKLLLNINLDMLAGSKKTQQLHYISHSLDTLLSKERLANFSKQHKNRDIRINKGFDRVSSNTLVKRNWRMASDHGVFYRHKIPFIYYGVGIHDNYHRPTDTFENINQLFFVQVVNIVYQQLRFLDESM